MNVECKGYRSGAGTGTVRSLFCCLPAVKEEWVAARAAHPNLWRLVCAYREHGHRAADLDPLQLCERYIITYGGWLSIAQYYYDGNCIGRGRVVRSQWCDVVLMGIRCPPEAAHFS